MSEDPLDLTNKTKLMSMTSGDREIKTGFIDGPTSIDHKDLLSIKMLAFSGMQMTYAQARARHVIMVLL